MSNYYLGDPCYVIPDDEWGDFCNIMRYDGEDFEYKGETCRVVGTGGDGDFGGLSVDGVVPEGYRLTDAELATGQAPPFPPRATSFNPLIALPPTAEEIKREQLMEQIAVREIGIDAPEAQYKAFLAEFGDKPNIAALEDQLINASPKTKRAF